MCVVQITADWLQNVDCRLPSGYKMQTEKCGNLSTYNSPNITHSLFCDQLSKLFAHFLIKIHLNIISSLHIVFSLCMQVGWCDVCIDFTNIIKVDVDVDVNEMSLLNI